MNLFAAASLLCGAVPLMLATFSFLSGRTKAYKLLMWFNIAVSFWGWGCFIVARADSGVLALMGWKLAHFGGYFIATLFYHLVSTVCGSGRKKIILFGYVQAFFFNALDLVTGIVMNKTTHAFGVFYNVATPLYSIAVFIHHFLVILSYQELVKFVKKVQGYRKVQARYIIFGFLFGFAGGTVTLLPEFGLNFIYPAGNFGIFVYVTIVTYAILRHNILDMEQIIRVTQRDKLAAIGTLATSINHEIRNPLYVIKGLAESHLENVKEGIYANRDEALQKSNEVLSKSIDQAQRAMEIMKRFALFAKQGVREEAQLEEVDLAQTFESILPLIRHELELDKIQLIKEISKELVPIRADRRHIEEIFFNLIVNACQAMKGGGELSVRAEQRDGAVRLEIQDQGPGIPSAELPKIFEPFYTTKESGTGLGLYITKQLVERNKGKISVKSKRGEGTAFTLTFKSL